MIHRMRMWAVLFVGSAALVLLAGNALAQGDAYKKAEETGKTMKQFREEIQKAGEQMQKTLSALSAVVQPGGDLVKKYKNLADQVKDLNKSAENVRKRSTDMRAKGGQYFAEWEKQYAAIGNEALRQKSQQRQRDIKAQFEKLQPLTTAAKNNFVPMMANLQDVVTYLGSDLTPGGVAAVGDMVKEIQGQAAEVKKSVDEILKHLDSIAAEISPPAK